MEDNKPKRPRAQHPERITLTTEALNRVSFWLEQVAPHMKGSSVTRSQLVSWALCNRDNGLSESEVSKLVNAFFDPVKAVLWAVESLKGRRKAGEEIDLQNFMSEVLATNKKPVVKKRNKKSADKLPSQSNATITNKSDGGDCA